MVKLTIDGQDVDVPKGTVIVDAAKTIGIEIPIFCYHDKMKPVAACRMCLVEIEKMRGLNPACAITVAEGMVVRTNTPPVIQQQKALLEMLLINHPLDCPVCDKGGECPLQDNTFKFGPGVSRYIEPKRHFVKPLQLSDRIYLDRERCIMCYRCVRFHSDIAQDNALGVVHRGVESEIGVAPGHTLDSPFQGNITEICPVGALTGSKYRFTARPWDIQNVPTVCPHCAVGCNTSLTIREGAIKRVLSRRNDPVDDGWLCDTGRYTFDYVNAADRLTTPLIRKGDQFVAASWREALSLVATRFAEIKAERGAEAIGGLCGPTQTNEEAYLFERFMRSVVGTNNVDSRRPEQGDSDAALQQLFGYRAAMGSIGGLELAKTIVLIGANPILEQPVLDLRIRKAVVQGTALVTVTEQGQRLDELAKYALRIKAGSEAALVNGLLHALIASGKVAPDAEQRFPGLTAQVQQWVAQATPAATAQQTGVAEGDIAAVAAQLVDGGPAAICYSESWADSAAGAAAVLPLAYLAILSGNVGKTGAALNRLPLYGNSQGTIDMGVLPHVLPGHKDVADVAARQALGAAWGADLPATPGRDTREMLAAARDGGLQALYVSGQDPASWGQEARDALAELPFLVVQDLTLTETAKGADVVLPAPSYAEQDGTFTNLERRIQRIRPAAVVRGDILPGWQIVSDLANRMGGRFYYGSAAEVMVEIAATVPIYAGVTYGRVGAKGIQWPVPDRKHAGTPFLYVEEPAAEPETVAAVSGTVA
jgi:NADH-quinone oxidoreductase subunit G